MPIIKVNDITEKYLVGQLQGMKITVFKQWRQFTGQPVEERVPLRALDEVDFQSSNAKCLASSAPTRQELAH